MPNLSYEPGAMAPAKEEGGGEVDSPLKWHGGKHYLASRVVGLMPPHVHYVEPFAGSLAVLLAKEPEGVSEAVNDLHPGLTNFWKVLIDVGLFEEFRRKCEATPFSEAAWKSCCDWRAYQAGFKQPDGPVDCFPVWCAYSFFVLCRQSLAGRMKAFAPLSRNRTRRGMNEQASAWLNAVEGLPAVHERLKRVAVLGPKCALEVIRQQDGENTLFYLDPPYFPGSRAAPEVYAHEMSEEGHHNLLCLVRQVKGKVLLSGYRNPMYDDLLAGWRRLDFDLPNHSAGGAEKRRMTESVWANY
jgi:DNA adenine methylase